VLSEPAPCGGLHGLPPTNRAALTKEEQMSKYLFIESRDPFEFKDVEQTWELAKSLASDGHDVAYFMVQNGIFAAREGAKVSTADSGAKVRLLVDDLSLLERGVKTERIRDGIEIANSDVLVDLTLEEGRKPVWM
jgi:predicted peroxiredoxin